MTADQSFLFRVSTIVVAVVILGAGVIYASFVLDGDPETEPPPSITLVLGLAMGQIANLILGRNSIQLGNGIQRTTADTKAGVVSANEKLDTAAGLVGSGAEEVKARQEEILKLLRERK